MAYHRDQAESSMASVLDRYTDQELTFLSAEILDESKSHKQTDVTPSASSDNDTPQRIPCKTKYKTSSSHEADGGRRTVEGRGARVDEEGKLSSSSEHNGNIPLSKLAEFRDENNEGKNIKLNERSSLRSRLSRSRRYPDFFLGENPLNISDTSSDISFAGTSTVERDLNRSGVSSESEVFELCTFCKGRRYYNKKDTEAHARKETTRRYSARSNISEDMDDDDDDDDDLSDIYYPYGMNFEVDDLLFELDSNLDDHPARILQDARSSTRTNSGPPLYPHRAQHFMECAVCLLESNLRRRVCCDYKICNECLNTYISMKVQEGRIEIECPNDRCSTLIHQDEVRSRLSSELKEKFDKFLIDANVDPCKKTCPSCSIAHTIDPDVLVERKKLKKGLKVKCRQCRLEWCFLCQAPFHTEMSCKQFKKGDEMVKKWAKEQNYGQANAQRCPKCKIFIQKFNGCDHMKCSQCHTNFCYSCGDRYIRMKFFGNHWSRFSLFGCKYRLLPKRPVLRRLIRGTNFAARVVAGVVLVGLGVAAGACIIGASVFILPGYGIIALRRQRRRKQIRERWRANRVELTATIEESEEEITDRQQVQAVVHRSVSDLMDAYLDEGLFANLHRCECYRNHFAADSEVVVTGGDDGEGAIGGDSNIVVVKDVKEVPNKSGYSTVVANIVSKVVEGEHDSGVGEDEEKQTSATNNGDLSATVEASSGENLETTELDNSRGSNKSRGKGKGVGTKVKKVSVAREDDPKGVSDEPKKGTEKEKSGKIDELSLQETDSGLGEETSQKSGEVTVKVEISEKPESKSMTKVLRKLSMEGKTLLLSEEADKSASPDETKTAKQGGGVGQENKEIPNGCFGNIFSKRTTAQEEGGLSIKGLSVGQTRVMNKKAATWEKIRHSKVEPGIKRSPFEAVSIQRSPSSASSAEAALGPKGIVSERDDKVSALEMNDSKEKDCGFILLDNKMNDTKVLSLHDEEELWTSAEMNSELETTGGDNFDQYGRYVSPYSISSRL